MVPYCYKASNSDPDTLTFDQAMSDIEHKGKWLQAAASEIAALESKGTWEEVPIAEAKTKILPGTWVFKLKRTPDGTVSKHKGRYCVRGDMQEGDFETHSQVVSWSSIRVFLVLSITMSWHTCSIDFSNAAFVQAVLDEPVWIHLPRGFRSTSTAGKTCL